MGSKSVNKIQQSLTSTLISTFATFIGFLVGFDIGTIGGVIAMPAFQQTFGQIQSNGEYTLPASIQSLILSVLYVGTFCGAILAYPCGDFIGRRWALIIACIIFSIGVLFETFAAVIGLFIIGRVIVGISLGLIACMCPVYQSECAPKSIRGVRVYIYLCFYTLGILIASIVSYATKDIPSNASYKLPIIIQLIWPAILAIGIYLLPESPRYLVLKGRIEQAETSQARLLSTQSDDPQVKSAIDELIIDIKLMKEYGNVSYMDCFKMGTQKNLLRTLSGIVFEILQPLTGFKFILYYGTTFFTTIGLANPFLITIIIDIVDFIGAIVGSLIIDKVGRRYVLIFAAIGMSISQFIIAIVGTILGPLSSVTQITLVVFICIFISFFGASWLAGPSIITSEIYPTPLRAKCSSLANAANWLSNIVLAIITPFLVNPEEANLGLEVFFIWASLCLVCALFAIFCIWETKGLSLEQINYLIRHSSPIESSKVNKQLRLGIIIDDDKRDIQNLTSNSMTNLNSDTGIFNSLTNMDKHDENTSLLGQIK